MILKMQVPNAALAVGDIVHSKVLGLEKCIDSWFSESRMWLAGVWLMQPTLSRTCWTSRRHRQVGHLILDSSFHGLVKAVVHGPLKPGAHKHWSKIFFCSGSSADVDAAQQGAHSAAKLHCQHLGTEHSLPRRTDLQCQHQRSHSIQLVGRLQSTFAGTQRI